jgi:uncharacterized DUF497 family protein
MRIEFDSAKDKQNFDKHGLRFEEVECLDWDTAIFKLDARKDYGEERFVAYVMGGARLYVVCFTERGAFTRILSYRKANKREEIYYAEKT